MNPECDCPGNLSSRRQLAGYDTAFPRTIHHCCATGRCNYFTWACNADGRMQCLPHRDYSVDQAMRLGL